MKVLIDIAEITYVNAINRSKGGFCNVLEAAVSKGLALPDNATNGDVFLAITKPYMYLPSENGNDDVGIMMYEGAEIAWFDVGWWNSPYKGEA